MRRRMRIMVFSGDPAGKMGYSKKADIGSEVCMISYVKGTLEEKTEDSVIIDNHGMGYRIFVPATVMERLPAVGGEIKVYTYFQVKEDGMNLYGFLNRDDLQVFRLLIGVNGIGPKGAMGVLSVLSADVFRFAVLAGDAKAIAKAPGVGNKTAQKVILELKDKVELEDAIEKRMSHQAELQENAGSGEAGGNVRGSAVSAAKDEAVMALAALGYSNTEALKAVSKVELTDDMDAEAILKQALKHMNLFG